METLTDFFDTIKLDSAFYTWWAVISFFAILAWWERGRRIRGLSTGLSDCYNLYKTLRDNNICSETAVDARLARETQIWDQKLKQMLQEVVEQRPSPKDRPFFYSDEALLRYILCVEMGWTVEDTNAAVGLNLGDNLRSLREELARILMNTDTALESEEIGEIMYLAEKAGRGTITAEVVGTLRAIALNNGLANDMVEMLQALIKNQEEVTGPVCDEDPSEVERE